MERQQQLQIETVCGTTPEHLHDIDAMRRACCLPAMNQHSLVGHLLNAIENSDPELQAAIALVRNDKGADGMLNDFEKAAACLVLRCPMTSPGKRVKPVLGNKQRSDPE